MKIDIIQFDNEVVAGTYGRWLSEWGVETRTIGPGDDHREFTGADALLLLGGHMGVHQREQHPLLNTFHHRLPGMIEQGQPLLAICLGAQLLADALGGKATARTRGEHGVLQVALTEVGRRDPLLRGVPDPFVSFAWHYDSFDLPPAAAHLASTDVCPGQIFRCGNAFGLQFHPEVDEQIIAGWCRRAGRDDAAVKAFAAVRPAYRDASRRILRNFIDLL